ncbi:MAG: ImmA/IrrE family metallo-endopeptidase [Anaerolineae bacterium]|nr:ImmA/IrrE family metallo-endopeptidase [Anaerolineae bacterium]
MQTTLTPAEQKLIDDLAQKIVKSYGIRRPPIPVETILKHPPIPELEAVDITDLSLVFGIGEHPYEYRMAIARLLYREICRSQSLAAGLPINREAARYFAACLLIPKIWILKALRRPRVTLQQLSEAFQVPEYVMTTRLAYLGKEVRGM